MIDRYGLENGRIHHPVFLSVRLSLFARGLPPRNRCPLGLAVLGARIDGKLRVT